MKTKKTVFYILMLLPLALVLVALQFLPDNIPAHYNISGQVDRWGSKYEMLVFPTLSMILGGIMLGVAKYAAKHEESGQNNAQVCILAGIMGNVLFSAMTAFFLYAAFQQVEQLSSTHLDIFQILYAVLGLSMIIVGNIMPKLRMNALIGLRTSWSMKNEITWKKSQRFGGISMIVGGIAIVTGCLLAKGMICFWIAMGILVLLLVVDIFYSYQISKKY